MAEHEPAATVRENPHEHRFEFWAGDRRGGLTVYEHRGADDAYVLTEVDPSFSGRALATQLVGTALDTMRDHHLEVLPFCPIVGEFVQRHPD